MAIFTREIVRDTTVITLDIPSLDAGNVRAVSRHLAEAFQGQGKTVLDLGALRYFDVHGFAAILTWVSRSSEGLILRLCSESGTIQALFELLRADSVVSLYRNRDEAIVSLRNQPPAPRNAVEASAPQEHEADPISDRRTA
jgi:anti-anti-sigma factor